MSTVPPLKLPRKKPGMRRYLIGGVVLLLAAFFYQLFGPSPAIVVSKETTYITEPLRPDGLPDYEKYVLDRMRDGVTPENNAAVLIWQAVGPGTYTKPEQSILIAKELGANVPAPGDVLVPADARAIRETVALWLRERWSASAEIDATIAPLSVDSDAGLEGDESSNANAVDPYSPEYKAAFDAVLSTWAQPWTSEQLPPMAEWIQRNNGPLDLIVAASHRTRFYMPSPTLLDSENESGSLSTFQYPGLHEMRSAMRSLLARAMWSLGEGRTEECWQDLHAMLRLANLMNQELSAIGAALARWTRGIALNATITMLHAGQFSEKFAQQIHSTLNELPSLSLLADALDSFERMGWIDMTAEFSSNGQSLEMIFNMFGEGNEWTSAIQYSAIDWNAALVEINRWFDRVNSAFRLPTRASKRQAVEQMKAELIQLEPQLNRWSVRAAAVLSRQARGQVIAKLMINRMFGNLLDGDGEDYSNRALEMARVSAALAVYRAQHGGYPAELSDLIPDVISELPIDSFSGQEFVYRREAEGYLLYSIGDNVIDERGSNEESGVFEGQWPEAGSDTAADSLRDRIPKGADDYAIRVPRPALAIPNVRPGE